MALTKVLVVSFDPIPMPDGKSVRLESILRALQGRYDVDVLCPRIGETPHVELRYAARIFRVPPSRGNLHAQVETFARAVRRQLDSEEYRLVHLCDPRVGGPVCELAPARGFKLLFEPLGASLLDLARTFPRIAENEGLAQRLRAAERLCLATADAVLVGTEQAARYVAGQGAFRGKVTVLPGAVDLGTFRPSHVARAGRPRVSYAGELAPWQGVGTLLRAAREVLRVRPQVRFQLWGPARAAHRRGLMALAARLGIEGAVEIGPPVPHARVPERLVFADLCVVPTEEDLRTTAFGPFPGKMAEAMAIGRAPVVSRVPAHAELASDGDEALFFAPGNPDELAERILRLLGAPEEREALGQRAHARLRESAAHEVFRARLLAIYAEILGEAARRAASEKTPLS
jgi:glycosyltransferase involved in cell wall biosynthesis